MMTAPEIAVFSVLWVVAVSVLLLVLAMYRAADRLFLQADAPSGGLPPGSTLPPLEVDEDVHLGNPTYTLGSDERIMLFVSPTCETCRGLLAGPLPSELIAVPINAIVVGAGDLPELADLATNRGDVYVEFVVDPQDVVRWVGVDRVPFAYSMRGDTVLAGGLVTTWDDVAGVVAAGRETAAIVLQSAPEDLGGQHHG